MPGGESDSRWTPELEVALFHSMYGHKPVGLNKHFHMACIQHRLQQSTGQCLSTKEIWDFLHTLYDLNALDDFERFPFPNEEKEFSLPEHLLLESKAHVAMETELKRPPIRLSSSPSPASSPLGSKQTVKRKRN